LELVGRLRRLYTPIISDILDEQYGVQASFVMSHQIRPLTPNPKLAGVAYPARGIRSSRILSPEEAAESPGIRYLEGARPGDVIVIDTNNNEEAAAWGELISNAVRARGAEGAVVDGLVRDLPRILQIEPPFPVFARGTTPADSKGRYEVVDFDIPIRCGGVRVNPGDYILGDLDGVVVIPQEVVGEVVALAEEKLRAEGNIREELRHREPVAKVFRRYGIL
jgi:regulator of RNase E activity RraA